MNVTRQVFFDANPVFGEEIGQRRVFRRARAVPDSFRA
jgi:hypothetical protein